MKSTVSFLATCVLAYTLVGIGVVTSASAQPHQSWPFRHPLVGSWLVTYDFAGIRAPILLSFGRDGVMIETDTPAPTLIQLAPDQAPVLLILSNAHGAWVPKEGGGFSYLYRQLVYTADGLAAFGTTRFQATGTTSANGTQFQATFLIEFLDTDGKFLFSIPGTATATRIQVEQP